MLQDIIIEGPITMARTPRGPNIHNLYSSIHVDETSPKGRAQAEFARRLYKALQERGWTQSELAERAKAFLPSGRTVGRDAISKYQSGKMLPSAVTLAALAKALDMAEDELMPTRGVGLTTANPDRDAYVPHGDGTATVNLKNRRLPTKIALEIMRLAETADDDEG